MSVTTPEAVSSPSPDPMYFEQPSEHRMDGYTVWLAFAAIVPSLITFDILGFRLSGWSWSLVLATGILAVLIRPLDPAALRSLTPLLGYLVYAVVSMAWTPDVGKGLQVFSQLAAIGIVYLPARRYFEEEPEAVDRLRRLALWVLPATAIVFLRAGLGGGLSFGWLRGGSARPMVMAVALLFVVATLGRSRRFSLTIGVIALAVAVASGGRTGTLVVAVLLLFSPAIGLRWRQRATMVAVMLAILLALIPTQYFQDRFFVGSSEGTVIDLLTFSRNVNTAGRSNNWPVILAACNDRSFSGHGIGASGGITAEVTEGSTNHPHNEYLRAYCDAGLVGALAFWAFFLAVGYRALRLMRLDPGNQLAASSVMLLFALFAFSATDNITIYTSVFMAPAAVIFAGSDWAYRRMLSS